MPAPPLANTLDGGTDTVTISAANSGGASGDAFSTVTNALTTYSTTQAHSGTLSQKLPQGATYASMSTSWTGLGVAGGADAFARFYLFIPALPSVNNPIIRWTTAAAATSGQLKINTTGFLQSGNASTAAIASTVGTISVATAQWIRVECRIRASTTAGQIEWRLFNSPESTTATQTKNSGTAEALGADTGGVIFGMPGTTGTINQTYFYDDLAVSSVDWIGPVASNGSRKNLAALGVG